MERQNMNFYFDLSIYIEGIFVFKKNNMKH